MLTGSQLIHRHIGAPAHPECGPAAGPCWVCGGDLARGQRVEDWQGAQFTGQNRIRGPRGTHVCEACLWVMSRTTPVPGRPPQEGKRFGGNWRNYSHLYDGTGTYMNASKGEKPLVLAFLRAPHPGPWFCAVADSGQKHLLPWVPVNPGPGPGRVLFEEREIALPAHGDARWAVFGDTAALLTAGATKEEIAAGSYGPGAWQRCGEQVRAYEERWAPERGGAWHELAVFLAQRDEAEVQARMEREKTERTAKKARTAQEKKRATHRRAEGRAAGAHDGGPAGDPAGPPGVAGSERPAALGPVVRPDAGGRPDVREPGGVDDARPAGHADRKPKPRQLALL